jgi:hypothetical protein
MGQPSFLLAGFNFIRLVMLEGIGLVGFSWLVAGLTFLGGSSFFFFLGAGIR